MQGRKLIALGGAALFLLGCVGFAARLYVVGLGVAASQLDRKLLIASIGKPSGNPGSSENGPPSSCTLEDVTPPTRTPVVGESFKLSLKFGSNQNCDLSVYTDAPGFEIGDNPRHFKIPPGESEQFIAIEAKNAGTHEIVVNNRVIGVHVLSNPFFSPSEMFVISGFLACLGPMAALPWWIDHLRDRGQRRLKSENESVT